MGSMWLQAKTDSPDIVDTSAILVFLALAIGLPALGYVCLVLDIRAYLRSLRRALVVVRSYLPHLPATATPITPRCLIALDLTMPCTAEQVKAAYRAKVKVLHPDAGGDRAKFLLLQRFFDESLDYLARYHGEADARAATTSGGRD